MMKPFDTIPTLLASHITPSPEWPTTHCVYPMGDGTWLSIADDGSVSYQPHALSGETFYYVKGENFITAVRGTRAYTLMVAAKQ